MSQDLLDIFLLGLLAACYPTLLAAVAVMLFLPKPKRLMFAYLLGAYTTGITLGLVIVFSHQNSDAVTTSKHTISPAQDVAIGLILFVVAFVLGTERDAAVRERRRERKRTKQGARESKEPWSRQMLGRGSARVSYAVGVVLSFPGVTYLTALNRIAAVDTATATTVLLVVGFCLIQLLLLELPLLGYAVAPERTQETVERLRSGLGRRARPMAIIGAAGLGTLLVTRGLIGLL